MDIHIPGECNGCYLFIIANAVVIRYIVLVNISDFFLRYKEMTAKREGSDFFL